MLWYGKHFHIFYVYIPDHRNIRQSFCIRSWLLQINISRIQLVHWVNQMFNFLVMLWAYLISSNTCCTRSLTGLVISRFTPFLHPYGVIGTLAVSWDARINDCIALFIQMRFSWSIPSAITSLVPATRNQVFSFGLNIWSMTFKNSVLFIKLYVLWKHRCNLLQYNYRLNNLSFCQTF